MSRVVPELLAHHAQRQVSASDEQCPHPVQLVPAGDTATERMRIIHPELRNENLDSNYPFADTATLTSRDKIMLPADMLVDASVYPIGGGARAYISSLVVGNRTVTIWVGDATDARPARRARSIRWRRPTCSPWPTATAGPPGCSWPTRSSWPRPRRGRRARTPSTSGPPSSSPAARSPRRRRACAAWSPPRAGCSPVMPGSSARTASWSA